MGESSLAPAALLNLDAARRSRPPSEQQQQQQQQQSTAGECATQREQACGLVVGSISILHSLSLSLSLSLLLLLKRTSFLPSPFASHHPTWVQQSAHFPCALFPPCTVALDRQLISRLIPASSVFLRIPHRLSPSMDHHDDDDEFPVSKSNRFTYPVSRPGTSLPQLASHLHNSRLGRSESKRDSARKAKTKRKKKRSDRQRHMPHLIPSGAFSYDRKTKPDNNKGENRQRNKTKKEKAY
ncbi:hypothetical protein IWZ01DRAFT_334330 [Phyllosticta capitalensis]